MGSSWPNSFVSCDFACFWYDDQHKNFASNVFLPLPAAARSAQSPRLRRPRHDAQLPPPPRRRLADDEAAAVRLATSSSPSSGTDAADDDANASARRRAQVLRALSSTSSATSGGGRGAEEGMAMTEYNKTWGNNQNLVALKMIHWCTRRGRISIKWFCGHEVAQEVDSSILITLEITLIPVQEGDVDFN